MSDELPMNADERLQADCAGGTATALLWWNQVPVLPGERLGVIGGFQATGAAAAALALERACAALRAKNCTLATGPMDGNTWRRYRLVTEAGTEPSFFLEPANPPEWPGWWQAVGFAPLAEYYSAATDDLEPRDARLESVRTRIRAEGITLRPLDLGQFEAELGRIYDVSVASFQENYLYTPLPQADFIAQYRAVQPLVRPELVRLAEHNGRPVGYLFAIPDQAQAQRGQPVTNVIMKTIAVLPEYGGIGLGGLLFADVHAAAGRLGFKRAIHALMHESNKSRRMSAHYARIIRRYTLFARRLQS
jgi:GNAT superfamily N-acetyltransferase